MQPQQLIDTAMAQGLPAPYWFIELFKVLGFSLHAVPMNLWYAGILIAMLLRAFGSEQGKRFSERLMLQMPVIIAFGVNLGIVPLLFIQVAYAKVFYPATVLMAWAWLGIIVLLIPAYYGVYIYAFGLRDREKAMPAWKQAAGWVAAILFIAIAYIEGGVAAFLTGAASAAWLRIRGALPLWIPLIAAGAIGVWKGIRSHEGPLMAAVMITVHLTAACCCWLRPVFRLSRARTFMNGES